MKKLSESVWGDVRRRAEGQATRKEDNLDNLSLTGFYDYWKDRYSIISKSGWKKLECIIDNLKREQNFCTPIEYATSTGFSYTYGVTMIYDMKTNTVKKFKIDFFDGFKEDYPNFKDVLGKEYKVVDGVITVINGECKFHHYIDIIDKFLNMVKKPYCKIIVNESVWGDVRRRADGSATRKEDEYNNIRHLTPLNMGGSVYWADQDLEVGDQYLFAFNEIKPLIEGTRWRLPTLEEVRELGETCPLSQDSESFYFGNKKLVFYKRGMIATPQYMHGNERISDDDFWFGWTSERYKSEQVHTFSFDDGKLICTPRQITSIMDPIVDNEYSMLSVRLVKDK